VSSTLLVEEVAGGVLLLALDRPAQRNALRPG
jgi:enoyl-CoA hydratase/carnithine racemase